MAWLCWNRTILVLLLSGWMLSNPAGAETLVGTVVSTGENLFTFQEKTKKGAEEKTREFRVVFMPANKNRPLFGRCFPRSVRPGRKVSLSGHFDKEKGVFLAHEIKAFPRHGKQHHDSTGVRSRLRRHRNVQGTP